MPPKAWEPIFTPRFLVDQERLRDEIKRLDELIEAILEVICRNPTQGKETARKFIYGFPLMRLPGNPGAVLYYSYTEKNVVLHFIICETDFPPGMIM